jgi:hypothetical protein
MDSFSEENASYCLMFDEMSIRQNFNFSQKLDCIEALEDHESQGKTHNIAYHALVFMIHGLHKKINTVSGSSEAEMIVQL